MKHGIRWIDLSARRRLSWWAREAPSLDAALFVVVFVALAVLLVLVLLIPWW